MSIEATPSKCMRLGDILLMRGLVDVDGLEAALDRQRALGGRIGESIVALGLISPDQLTAVLDETPTMPLHIGQTGVSRASLLALVLKFMRTESCETLIDLSNRMRLSVSILQALIEHATTQRLVEVLGSTQIGNIHYLRYALTGAGRVAASEAHAQSSYLGPAPVSLESFRAQVEKQSISNEKLSEEALRQGFADLIIPHNYFRKLLPAVRAGRTILLYGPPGNGKSSIGTRLGKLFQNVIYIPYAIEVSGQIITLYDSRLHQPYTDEANTPAVSPGTSVQHESFDLRWVACRRPIALAGGELTLEMLDLRYDPVTKFYDAPLHMKALNGMFLIDDFGRQKVNPTDLLNRWIMPLEDRIDYLMLNTGMSFQIPFDALVIFSTNLEPAQLMDQAFLRRIPYKIELFAPNDEEFRQIFFRSATAHGLQVTAATIDYILKRLAEAKRELAYFQPNFLCAQISQICSCFELSPDITPELADEAMENLYVDLRR
jgi:hypothetical protein